MIQLKDLREANDSLELSSLKTGVSERPTMADEVREQCIEMLIEAQMEELMIRKARQVVESKYKVCIEDV